MRGALARLSLGKRAASSSSSSAAASQAAQAAAAGLPPSTRRVLADPSCALALGVSQGRALVVRRPVALGDVLLEEAPVAAAPAPDRDPRTQCHHCLRLLVAGGAPLRSQQRPPPPPREPAIREEEGEEEAAAAADEAALSTGPGAAPRRADKNDATTFCSDACALEAEAAYGRVERRVDLRPLREHCAAQRERFPLVAARLACAVLQAWESGGRERALALARGAGGGGKGGGGGGQQHRQQQLQRPSWLPRRALRATSAPAAAASATAARAEEQEEEQEEEQDSAWVDAVAAEAADSQLGPMPAIAYLCHANLPAAAAPAAAATAADAATTVLLPAAWQRSHALLVRAVGGMLDAEPPGSAARLLPAARAVASPRWYARVLSRLHLNSFRVEAAATAPLLLAAQAAAQEAGRSAAEAASADFTAALLSAAAADPASQALGSAVYSAASLCNHSCDPSADAAWPSGDARLRLTARRALAPGEQVTITYVDASLEVEERRALLRLSYGFECRCARCVEELAALPPDVPPLPR
jgi:hypothetical protein